MSSENNRYRSLTLDQIAQRVNFERGYIAIGFSSVDASRRAPAANPSMPAKGLTQEENDRIIASEIAKRRDDETTASASLWQRLFALLPSSILATAVSEYSSTLAFAHCEIALFFNYAGRAEFGGEKMLAIGVSSARGVFVWPRAYKELYRWVYVPCEKDSMYALLLFAWSERHKKFSPRSMTRTVTNPGPEDRSCWSCAHFTMACLENLPLPDFHLNPPNKVTTDDIYDLATRPDNSLSEVAELVPAQISQLYGGPAQASIGPPLVVSERDAQRFAKPV